MDVHRGVDATVEDVVEAHKKDVEAQEKHGVKYLNYWVDADEGAVFCPFEGPSKEAGEKVHEEAHGLTADEIYEVEQGERRASELHVHTVIVWRKNGAKKEVSTASAPVYGNTRWHCECATDIV